MKCYDEFNYRMRVPKRFHVMGEARQSLCLHHCTCRCYHQTFGFQTASQTRGLIKSIQSDDELKLIKVLPFFEFNFVSSLRDIKLLKATKLLQYPGHRPIL
jgi:hypothetical protein